MKKIPIYFNYTGKYPDLLDKAKKSIPEEFEVRVNFENPVRPFTYCLNKILNSVDEPVWFFMHYDAQILDSNILNIMLEKYYENKETVASVCACNITDLLILFDTEKIKKIGGWDEGFQNSYMELDLRNRIFSNGFTQPIIYDVDCPKEIDHDEASKLRYKNDKDNNLYEIYIKSLKNDIIRFKEKYPEQGVDEILFEKIMNETWETQWDTKLLSNKNIDINKFLFSLFQKYLSRSFFTEEEFNFHLNEIVLKLKTIEQKENEFANCEEAKTLIINKVIKKYLSNNKLSEFDIYFIKYIIFKFNFNIEKVYDYFDKYGPSNKIAVTYSGHVRNYASNFNNTNKFFLSKINPDIFIHTWGDYGFQNANNYLPNVSWFKKENAKINEVDLISKYKPKKIIVENLKEKINTFSFPKNKIIFYFYGQAKDNASKYINAQLYSINKSNLYKNNFERKNNKKYDLSIRMRFDFIFNKEINLDGLSDILYITRENKKIIYIAHPINSAHGHPGGGGGCKECEEQFKNDNWQKHTHSNDICDIIAISSSENMDHYCSMYDVSEKIYEENSKNNIENIKKYNLEYIKDDNMYYIMQFGDAIEKYSFCYYPEKLLTTHLSDFILLNENVFFGEIKR